MKLGIVLFPTKEIQDLANGYRKRYDPNYALLSPHITLKEAFKVEQDQLPVVVAELRQIALNSKPFQVEINKISHFYPTNNVIYFAVQENKAITQLHEELHKPQLLQHERNYAFVPHITIGQHMPDDELHDIYNRIKMNKINFILPVDRFHLLYQLENDTWSIHQTFNLGE